MEHFYETIPGWTTFQELYTEVVNKFDNAVFVEVGTWKGKSAAYMGVEISNHKKNIKLHCVDPWTGETNDNNSRAYECPEKHNNSLYECFLQNISPVAHIIEPMKMRSIDAVEHFSPNSVDFIFIDASHAYEDVLQDITAWYPKLKRGGIMAGHDYNQIEVRKAVNDFFGNTTETVEELHGQISWKVAKP